jgi:hypothetical protein
MSEKQLQVSGVPASEAGCSQAESAISRSLSSINMGNAGTEANTETQEILVTSRGYQLEMLEESLKRNIILTVGSRLAIFFFSEADSQTRWILVAAKLTCKLNILLSQPSARPLIRPVSRKQSRSSYSKSSRSLTVGKSQFNITSCESKTNCPSLCGF